jgi:hypothetical protein
MRIFLLNILIVLAKAQKEARMELIFLKELELKEFWGCGWPRENVLRLEELILMQDKA